MTKKKRKTVGRKQEKRNIKQKNTKETHTNEAIKSQKGWRKEDGEGKKKELNQDKK